MSEEKDTTRRFPSVEDFCINVPLYESYDKSKDFDSEQAYYNHIFIGYENFSGQIDCFCIECNNESVFISSKKLAEQPENTDFQFLHDPIGLRSRIKSIEEYTNIHASSNRLFALKFHCVRQNEHIIRFVFCFHNGMLTKIGQYPSLADLASSEIKKYQKILGQSDYREFSKAVGLTAHGIGIGAFVYLRRIFERLIEEAHQEAKKSDDWDDSVYC